MSGQLDPSRMDDLVSLYVHIPFCIRRCNYCDFNTYAGQEEFIPAYVDALCQEINRWGESVKEKVHTIFFGGGTPSVLSPDSFEKIFKALRTKFILTSNPEISMEVNPGSIKNGFLEKINAFGVNRMSIGMQSAIPEELTYLGRIHTPKEIIQTVKSARKAGFKNISLDLMFGLPGQTMSDWQRSLDFALNLKPSHLSLYSLSYERGTRLETWRIKGLLPVSEEDLSAEMYELAIDYLIAKDYCHYEISNWAQRDGKESKSNYCKHNLQYWLNRPYLGFGAGAHSFYEGSRWENIRTIRGYIQASKLQPDFPPFARHNLVHLSDKAQMQETMFMGLRLLEEGVSKTTFQQRFGKSIEDVFPREINELMKLNLVTWKGINNDRLCLTRRGNLVGNQVFMYFVD